MKKSIDGDFLEYEEFLEYMLIYYEKYGGRLSRVDCLKKIAESRDTMNMVTFVQVEQCLDKYTSEELAKWRNCILKKYGLDNDL